jgi:aminoglycoside phosphotransferase (APT) family kinase protein
VAAAGDDILELVRRFLAAQLAGSAPPRIEGVERVAVGRSRENWLFDAIWPAAATGADDVVEHLIVRRDPMGGLLETSRADEFAVLQALEGTAVPAPRARWLDAEGTHLGRPSLVMVREPGECDYFVLDGERPRPERVELARRFCDLLASLHRVEWAGAGMGRLLADPGPWASRAELDRWEAVLRRDQAEPYPELELALGWLRSTAPRSARTVLVHGDFKPGNVLLDGDRIVALLDWELAHLGDPMEDLGWVTQPLRRREHLIPEAWERQDLLAHYQAATGFEVDEASVAWWNVLASFKTAVMQVTGLRSFVEGRSDEPYRPTPAVIGALLDAVAPPAARQATGDTLAAQAPGPTADHIVDQQLGGALRLLEQVAADPELPASSAAAMAEARRLLRQAATGWSRALPFLAEDNQRLTTLLGDLAHHVPDRLAATIERAASRPDPLPADPAGGTRAGGAAPADLSVTEAHRANLALRHQLAELIAALPDTADPATQAVRSRLADELRRRLATDPAHTRPRPSKGPAA